MKLKDAFMWNLKDKFLTPKRFAEFLCEDLDLPTAQFVPIVEDAIKAQIAEHLTLLFSEVPFEEDTRIVINLDILFNQYHLIDRFEWDLSSSLTPEAFALQLAQDLGLGSEFPPLVAHAIHEQIAKVKTVVASASNNTPSTNPSATEDVDEANLILGMLRESTRPLEIGLRQGREHDIEEWGPIVEEMSREGVEKYITERERDKAKRQRNNRVGALNRKRNSFLIGFNAAFLNAATLGDDEETWAMPEDKSAWKCSYCLCTSKQTLFPRNGPAGPKTLCNACGLFFKTNNDLPAHRKDLFFAKATLSRVCPVKDVLNLYSTCSLLATSEARMGAIRRSVVVIPEDAEVQQVITRLTPVAHAVRSLILPLYEEGYSDTEEYPEDDLYKHTLVLPLFRALLCLEFGGVSNLSCLECLSVLENLRIYGFSVHEFRIKDLFPLTKLPKLKILQIEMANVDEFTPVSQIVGLERLKVSNTSFPGLVCLGQLEKLKELDVSFTQVKTVARLPLMSSLRVLSVAGCLLADWGPVFECVWLTELNVSRSNVHSVSNISLLENLQKLNLSGTFVESFAPVSALLSLEELDISHNGLIDCALLSPLTQLKCLNLNGCELEDVRAIESLTQLQKLNLSKANLTDDDLIPVGKLLNLRHLYIYSTNITSIQPLSSLVHLRAIGLSGSSSIDDLSPLHNLHQLRDIGLSGLRVLNPEILFGLPHLQNIFFIQSLVQRDNHLQRTVPKSVCLWVDKSQQSRLACVTNDPEMAEFELKKALVVM
ncbi:UNVERIFIED_CONTAM: Chromatin structure remodeling complex protein sfh1 [Siphonaria sp. JEL0065]|nr:Chromatin structure remodeling complex protein sfh1 [Siphonaria sp. JEL0065]